MASFDFFLSLKWPEVDFSATNNDAFADFIKQETVKFIAWPVLRPIDYSLDE
jgi:hypothetical protein